MFQGGSPWRRLLTPIALAIVSLIAAVALWVAVTEAENPRSQRNFGAAIAVEAINVPEGLAVANISQSAVRLTVNATDADFAKLSTEDFRVQVDMTGVRESKSSQVVIARVDGVKNVDIVEVSPLFVDVTLEPETSKQVPVQVNRVGSPGQGFQITSVQTKPEEVRVVGATSLVQRAESAAVDINLTGVRTNVQEDFKLTPRDSTGADLPRLKVDPATAEVKLNVAQQDATLQMPVQVQTQGSLAEGYAIASVALDPQIVTTSGTQEVLQGVTTISTEAIDLSGARSDVIRTVKLKPPTGVQLARDSVTVTIKIKPQTGEKAIPVAPVVIDIPDGLQATLQTTSISVRLQGDVPTLNTIQPGAVKATVSVAGLGEGVHVLPPQISAPPGVTVSGFQPEQAVVVLRK